MISKKSRKVVAALLIGATVCASGTFAYFNSRVDLSKLATDDKALQKLDITNGYIKVTGTLNGSENAKLSGWTYDVARKSTDEALADDTGAVPADWKTSIQNLLGDDVTAVGADSANNYVKANESPDITGFTTVGYSDTYNGINAKLKVGTALERDVAITKARPGDAIVLGGGPNGEATGITIKNESNLTTKAKVEFVNQDSTKDQLKALSDAGWIMYVNDTKIDLSIYTDSDEIKDGEGNVIAAAQVSALTQINNVLNDIETSITPQGEATLNVRFELPLLTNNAYQLKNTGGTGSATAFDLSGILDIVVTQENNPGWNNDGTTTHPATSEPDNGTAPTP